MKSTLALSLMTVLFLGCSSGGDPGDSALDVTADGFRGVCAGGVSFEAADVAGVFDISVRLTDLSLYAIIDSEHQLAEIDGFANSDGFDTQIVERDRALLADCHRALEAQFGEDASFLENYLVRTLSMWAQTPDTVELQRSVSGDEGRAYTSICSLYNSYQYATHDGWRHSNWDPDATSIARVGTRESCTYSWINGSWTCNEPNHVSYVYQRGQCYGNCGGGCPSGNQQLTWDCLDHDQCVRNGHSLASFWCNDEFVSAADDELFAPSCSGT